MVETSEPKSVHNIKCGPDKYCESREITAHEVINDTIHRLASRIEALQHLKKSIPESVNGQGGRLLIEMLRHYNF